MRLAMWLVALKSRRGAMKPDQSNHSEPCPRKHIPPEILEWARQTFDEEEFLGHIREIEATGGLRLEDFISEASGTKRCDSR
jgi:hypothetical protein